MKLFTYAIFFLVISGLLFFSSCSFQKRLYTKGFYKSNNQSTKKLGVSDSVASLPSFKNIKQLKKQNFPTLLAQVSKAKLPDKKNNYLIIQFNTSNCDTIILKSGATLLGTVTKISNKKVFFKNCDTTHYSSTSVNQTDIAQIKFANGIKGIESFVKPPATPNHGATITSTIGFILITTAFLLAIVSSRGSKTLGISLLLFLLAFIFLITGAIFLIISAILRNKSNPKS